MGTGAEVTREEAAAVFRRAAEIELQQLPAVPQPTLDMASLEQIGSEAGLSADAIRQALVELRMGAIGPGHKVASAVVHRVVHAPAAAVQAHLDRFLRRQLFEVKRRFPEQTVWQRRAGLVPEVQRVLDVNRRLRLNDVDEVRASVVEEPGRPEVVHVRLCVDMGSVRRAWTVAAVTTSAAAVSGSAVMFAVLGTDPLAFASVPVTGGLAAGSYAVSRLSYRRAVERATTALERLLDDLQHGR